MEQNVTKSSKPPAAKWLVIPAAVLVTALLVYAPVSKSDLYVADDFKVYTPGFQARYCEFPVFFDGWAKLLFDGEYSKDLEITPYTFRPLFPFLIIMTNKVANGDTFRLRIFQFVTSCLTCCVVGFLFLRILNSTSGAIVAIVSYLISGSMAYQFTWLVTNPYNMGVLLFALCGLTFCVSVEKCGWRRLLLQVISGTCFMGTLLVTETGIMLPFVAAAYSILIADRTWRKALKDSVGPMVALVVYFVFRFVWIHFPLLPSGSQYASQAGSLLFGAVGQYGQYISRNIEAMVVEIVPWDYLTSWYGAVISLTFWVCAASYILSDWQAYRRRVCFVLLWVFLNSLPLFAMSAIRLHFIIAIGPCLLLGWVAQDVLDRIETRNYSCRRLPLRIALLILLWVGALLVQYQGARQVITVMSSGDSAGPLALGAGTLRFRIVGQIKRRIGLDTERQVTLQSTQVLASRTDENIFHQRQKDLFEKCKQGLSSKQQKYAEQLGVPPVIVHSKDGKVMVIIPPGEFRIEPQNSGEHRLQDKHTSAHTYIPAPFYVDATPVTWLEYLRLASVDGNIPKATEANVACKDAEALYQPMTGFSHVQAQEYARILGKRLLTEAEYEYIGMMGQNGTEPDCDCGNFIGKSGPDVWDEVAPVAQFRPNRFAVYDMAGNVWQMVDGRWDTSRDGVSVFIPLRGGSALSSAGRLGLSARVRWHMSCTGTLGFRTTAPISTLNQHGYSKK
jgi:formylglycine-generating enzyme required for sulfatase activity